MTEIRVHHLYNFTRALVSERYRNRFIRECYSGEQSKKVARLLKNVQDSTRIKIVTCLDDICRLCPSDVRSKDNCEFPDSVWSAKEFMHKIAPNEVVTAAYLIRQFQLYQRVRRKTNWKKSISASRTQSCGISRS